MSIVFIAVRPRLLTNASKCYHNERLSNKSHFIHHNFSHSPESIAVFCNIQCRKSSRVLWTGGRRNMSCLVGPKCCEQKYFSQSQMSQKGTKERVPAARQLNEIMRFHRTLIAVCFSRPCHYWITVYPVFLKDALASPSASVSFWWLSLL